MTSNGYSKEQTVRWNVSLFLLEGPPPLPFMFPSQSHCFLIYKYAPPHKITLAIKMTLSLDSPRRRICLWAMPYMTGTEHEDQTTMSKETQLYDHQKHLSFFSFHLKKKKSCFFELWSIHFIQRDSEQCPIESVALLWEENESRRSAAFLLQSRYLLTKAEDEWTGKILKLLVRIYPFRKMCNFCSQTEIAKLDSFGHMFQNVNNFTYSWSTFREFLVKMPLEALA